MALKDQNADWKYHIFLQKFEDVCTGDHAIIYETERNPGYRDENGRVIKRGKGRKAVIALVRVSSPPDRNEDPEDRIEELEDGTVHDYRYYVKTELVKECFIPLYEVRRALQWQWWCARGHGGIWKLSEDQFNRILANC